MPNYIKNQIRRYLLAIFLLAANSGTASVYIKLSDSLAGKEYSFYTNKFNTAELDHSVKEVYAHAWLQKSKSEKNLKQQLLAYRQLMHISTGSTRFRYADTLLLTADYTGDHALIGSAHLTVGAAYHHEKQYLKALNHYLAADQHVSKTDDEYLQNKVKYTIGNIKYYLGYYNEAIALLNGCIEYFKEEDEMAYLKSVHSIGLCYIGIKRYDLSTMYNNLGLIASRDLDNNTMIPYFKHSEGVNQFFKKNYRESIALLKESLPLIKEQNDFANETVAWFYIGKNHLALQQPEEAIKYFEHVDKLILQHNYIRPDLRENYELLIDYFKENGNKNKLEYYINRLLHVDQKLNTEYKYLIGKVFKVYDTNELLRTQIQIEDGRKTDQVVFIVICALLLILTTFLTLRHRNNKKQYRTRFEELMKESSSEPKRRAKISADTEPAINPEIVAAVLANLEKFEKQEKFIEKDMTLAKVAAFLDVNTKYASQIIQHHRGKKFTDYINHLKITYIMNLLINNKVYRNYTNQALADQAGFGSTQNFTRAFKDRTGIPPTFFIDGLQNSSVK